jgi:hypothetical protein
MTNEAKLESARQELRKLPEQWRNLFANHQSLVSIRDARVETLIVAEALNRPGNPLNPAEGEFGGRVVAGIENTMLGRAAIPHVLVAILESLPDFKEAVAAVGKVVDKIKKLEAAVAADREALAKAEADLAEAKAAFIAEAQQQFEASKRETIEADPRFEALRDAAEAARAKVAAG